MRTCFDQLNAHLEQSRKEQDDVLLFERLKDRYTEVAKLLEFLPDTTKLHYQTISVAFSAAMAVIVLFDPSEAKIAELESEIEKALGIKLIRSGKSGENYEASAVWKDLVIGVLVSSRPLDDLEELETEDFFPISDENLEELDQLTSHEELVKAFDESGPIQRLPDKPEEKSWWDESAGVVEMGVQSRVWFPAKDEKQAEAGQTPSQRTEAD